MEKRVVWRSLALVLLLGLVVGACSSGGGGSSYPPPLSGEKVLLTGNISSGSQAGFLNNARALTVNSVWAIPIAKMQGANIDSINVMLRKPGYLSNGAFSFQLEKTMTLGEIKRKVPNIEVEGMSDDTVFEVDWLLVLMDGRTPVSVMQLAGDATYDSLVSIPISAFTETSLDIGQVNSADGTAAVAVSEIENKVTIDSEGLQILSRSDDILKSIKDIIRNCDLTTNKCIEARQSFVFTGTYANLGTDYDMGNAYSGYQLYFDVNDFYGPADFDNICTNFPTVSYTLTPPSDITVNSTTYGPSNPLSTGLGMLNGPENRNSNETICSWQDTFLFKQKDSSGNWAHWQLQFITGDQLNQLTTDMPDGEWVLKRDTEEIAKFEFKTANPVDANGHTIVVIPGLFLKNSSGSGVLTDEAIQTVEIKWYRWDPTANDGSGDYVEITDLAMLDGLMGGFELAIGDWDGITGNPTERYPHWNNLSFATDTTIDVSNPDDGNGPFYYDHSGSDQYNADYIGISYQFGGQGFRFAWIQSN